MSYLTFHSRATAIRLSGREVAHIAELAKEALIAELARPAHRRLRADLDLPPADSMFFGSQVFWLMSDGQPYALQGQQVYLFDVALNILNRRQPAAGILCWLYDHALVHGWIAGADRPAFAAELQTALQAGAASPNMGWEGIMSFLHDGTGEVVTSMSIGAEFPGYQVALDTGTWQPAVTKTARGDDELEGLWDQLGEDRQWDLCTQAIRGRPSLRWQPDANYLFGDFTIQDPAGLVPCPAPA